MLSTRTEWCHTSETNLQCLTAAWLLSAMFLVLCSFNRHGVRRTSHSCTQNWLQRGRRGKGVWSDVLSTQWEQKMLGEKIKHSLATKTETEMGRDHNVALYYGTTTTAFPLLCIQPVVWYHDCKYPTYVTSTAKKNEIKIPALMFPSLQYFTGLSLLVKSISWNSRYM